MPLTIRTRLLLIPIVAAGAFLIFIVTGIIFQERVEHQLTTVRERYVPLLQMGPRVERSFAALQRAFQDAVATQDVDVLARASEARDRLHAELNDPAWKSTATVDARVAVDEYYQSASGVSRRLMKGETGESMVEAISEMQLLQQRADARLRTVTYLDGAGMARAFAAASEAHTIAGRVRFVVSVFCLAFLAALSVALSRSVLRTVHALRRGVARFGTGDFTHPIEVAGADELTAVAVQTNAMADNLRRQADEAARTLWLQEGEAGLSRELRGELPLQEVARRALVFLAKYTDAAVGAFYEVHAGTLRRLAQHATDGDDDGAPVLLKVGEGIVGAAAAGEHPVVLHDVPPGYLRIRSALGEATPATVVCVPIVHVGPVRGVIELGFFKTDVAALVDLLRAVRGTLAIVLEVARSREVLQSLFAESQRQGERLAAQEEELRANNEELTAQQDALQNSNEALAARAAELESSRRVVEATNADLKATQARLEQKAQELLTASSYKSRFLANMSHELRTPLNSMLLLSDMLASNEDGNLTPRQIDFCQTINSAGRDLLGLINQVLDLSKIEAGKQQARIDPVTISEVFDRVRRIFAPQADSKSLRLNVEVADNVPEVFSTDWQRLDQILNNLIGNAIKFTDSGQVSVRASWTPPADGKPDVLCVAVSDTGIGIATELQERVFAPFEQVDDGTTRRFGGTGLGLTIARELAVLLGGTLELSSEVGKGSVFVLRLPNGGSPVPVSAPATKSVTSNHTAVALPATADLTKEPFILIVEDDPVFAEALTDVVARQGLSCEVARDARTGLRIARERVPSGIVLDVRLPDAEGWQVMEQLRADETTAAIPVHFITAADERDRAMAMGAIGYLTKPVSRAEIVRVLQALLPGLAARMRRVLVVESETDVANSLIALLRDEELDVQRVGTAAEAVEALSTREYALMVIDLSLPDMDGLALLDSLEERGIERAPPIVVYTARPLSKGEVARLEAYTEAIVLREGPSLDRLVNEIRLFVRRLKEARPLRRVDMPSSDAPEVRLDGRHILVVDDDIRTVYAISAFLRAKGADVAVADNGRAALDALAARPHVDLVLMDMMMPGMDGFEALAHIRSTAVLRPIPVIALTAKAIKGDRDLCLKAGASDYLAKPIDGAQLLRLIARWVGPRSSMAVNA